MDRFLTEEKMRGPPFERPFPHVVILGAGASKAAFPDGDKNGKVIPLMDGLPCILGEPWRQLVRRANPQNQGFESQYSWIRNTRMFSRELIQIEEMIEEYFESLVMPDHPTIYDYLVLGLRDKDVIATFNWDPFLYYAHKRNRGVAPLPEIRFLHGCVVFATCHDHDILACPYEICPECNKVVKRARLFLPDSDKDYTKDAVIMREWGAVCDALNNAFHVTIFGYSGPATDYNARELLRERWQKAPFPDHSDVEIIDIKDENELRECWSEFIRYDHAMVRRDFWSSTIALYPRRTAEYKLGASVHGKPAEYIGPFHTDSLHDLQTWFCKLAEPETNHS